MVIVPSTLNKSYERQRQTPAGGSLSAAATHWCQMPRDIKAVRGQQNSLSTYNFCSEKKKDLNKIIHRKHSKGIYNKGLKKSQQFQ